MSFYRTSQFIGEDLNVISNSYKSVKDRVLLLLRKNTNVIFTLENLLQKYSSTFGHVSKNKLLDAVTELTKKNRNVTRVGFIANEIGFLQASYKYSQDV